MEGFQFGEQTQETGTLLNGETGGGERGSRGGHGLRNIALETQRFGCSLRGGRRRLRLEAGLGWWPPREAQVETRTWGPGMQSPPVAALASRRAR